MQVYGCIGVMVFWCIGVWIKGSGVGHRDGGDREGGPDSVVIELARQRV